tara:strand:+ start:453 stop:707 length:255 start_codon:yes stop_codon:yes gene_type:complete
MKSKLEVNFIVVGIKFNSGIEAEHLDQEMQFLKLANVPDFKTELEALDFINTMKEDGNIRHLNEFDFVEIKKVFIKVFDEDYIN